MNMIDESSRHDDVAERILACCNNIAHSDEITDNAFIINPRLIIGLFVGVRDLDHSAGRSFGWAKQVATEVYVPQDQSAEKIGLGMVRSWENIERSPFGLLIRHQAPRPAFPG